MCNHHSSRGLGILIDYLPDQTLIHPFSTQVVYPGNDETAGKAEYHIPPDNAVTEDRKPTEGVSGKDPDAKGDSCRSGDGETVTGALKNTKERKINTLQNKSQDRYAYVLSAVCHCTTADIKQGDDTVTEGKDDRCDARCNDQTK